METLKDLERQLYHAENDKELLTHWLNTGFLPAGATKDSLEEDYDKIQEKIRELKSKIRKAKHNEPR